MNKVRTVTWRSRLKWVIRRIGRRITNLIGEMR
jgi:hypothetical protein